MPTVKLDQRRVDALKPRKSAYNVRDRDLKGFGLRVWPSGKKRYFVHSQHRGRRVWKTIASAESASAGEARARAATMLATIRRGGDAPASPEETVFEAVADEVFTRYARNWKPGTLKVNRNYYRNHILPRFKGRPIAGIDSRDVRQWFASLHAKPAAADRSAPILSVIMRQAEIYGYRPVGSNPCKGIKRYRREGRERFLSAAEIRSLAAALDRFETDRPQQVAIIRLLLLTGCRASEVRTLKWRYRREGKLFLPDTKTGGRAVPLAPSAVRLLTSLPRDEDNPWVIAGRKPGWHLTDLQHPWRRIRGRAGLDDVRIHDLRHSFASRALALGEGLRMIGKLLGHTQVQTTARYAHLARDTVKASAARIGDSIDRDLDAAE